MSRDHISIEVFIGHDRRAGSRGLSRRFSSAGAAKRIDFLTLEGGVHLERVRNGESQAVSAPYSALCGRKKRLSSYLTQPPARE